MDAVRDIQAGLKLLGYDPGPINGKATKKTNEAMAEFAKNNKLRLDSSSQSLLVLTLALRVLESGSSRKVQELSQRLQAVAGGIRNAQPAAPGGECTPSWIGSVGGNGEVVVLGDGSIYEVDLASQLHVALWLPATQVLVCGNRIINKLSGQTAKTTRIK